MGFGKRQYGRSYYEGIFSRSVCDSQRNRDRLGIILSSRKEGSLLEIGCGKGEFLRLAARHFVVEGVEISEYAVDSLGRWPGARIRREDVERSDLRANAYDVIAAFNVLEHLTEPAPVIHKIQDALRNDGVLIGSVPHNATLIGRAHTALTNVFDRTHCSTYPPHRWHSLFAETGFREIRFFGEVMMGKNLNSYVQHRFWRFIALNLMFLCVK